MPSYDPNNIFAKILRGELPSYKVYEDHKAFAFLDIMPRAPGHTLVLPKAPARNILDVNPDDLAHVMAVAQKVAKAAMKAFEADGVTMQQFNEGRVNSRPGTRTATMEVPAVTSRGTSADDGSTRVRGPGQNRAPRRSATSGQATQRARTCSRSAATTGRGFPSSRPLAARTRRPASLSKARPPRAYSVSVG